MLQEGSWMKIQKVVQEDMRSPLRVPVQYIYIYIKNKKWSSSEGISSKMYLAHPLWKHYLVYNNSFVVVIMKSKKEHSFNWWFHTPPPPGGRRASSLWSLNSITLWKKEAQEFEEKRKYTLPNLIIIFNHSIVVSVASISNNK